MSDPRKKRKNPYVALILSGVLPGLGQLYNNQILKGLILVALNFVISLLVRGPLVGFIESGLDFSDKPALFILGGYTAAGLALLVFAMIDAKKTADRLNRENGVA
ncbi:MAG: hypothetical protein RIG61_00085 [Deltaproteobacteria bacterium]